ncbi:amidohydrolase [Diplodia corticola]|uniref:Amidohydrolase n=1 Tax=Diplodia corticola TaxID=236234 RepID=A0A1J9QT27_9PEZI|nr:amidohydrolase [Diplodia corticola]OJD32118.1 amidohydrolase [Diplodia corticola]
MTESKLLSGESKLSPEVAGLICQAIDDASDELRRLNLEIYNNPETKYEEFKAFKLLTTWFENQGWTVKRSVYDIETAFEARFSVGQGGRTIAYNAEYDALPKIGHACGHNLIATSTLASALGTAAGLRHTQTAGTVLVVGTPAEETGGGKYYMAQRGCWADASACLMTHAMPDFSTPVCVTKASWKFRAFFRGKAAHAAAAPWEGRNACDAIVGAYEGIARLRQHLDRRAAESVQGVILSAGEAPNVVPEFAEGTFSIRARDAGGLRALRERVVPVFEGAAAAAGCAVELRWDALYEDVVTNEALAGRYREHMVRRLGMAPADMVPVDEARGRYEQDGSSDMGNVTYLCPGIQPMFRIDAGGPPHTPAFREAAGTEFAHGEALRAGKANALVGFEVVSDGDFYSVVRDEWEAAMERAVHGPWAGCHDDKTDRVSSTLSLPPLVVASDARHVRREFPAEPESNVRGRPASRVRGSLCKSNGADCQFVQPRAITRPATGAPDAPLQHQDRSDDNDDDHDRCRSERLDRLEGQLARLTDVVEGMRGDLTAGLTAARPTDRPNTNLNPPVAHGNLVTRGVITEEECVRSFETFLSQCEDTIAIFDGIPHNLDAVRQEPILLAVVCAVGARALDPDSDMHQKCLAETKSLTSAIAFGPPPTLFALRGIMLLCAWYHHERLWGTVITTAYGMGLHQDALRLSKEAETMNQDQIERARTWLSILTYELMANTSRPYLIGDSQRYMELAQGLVQSHHSRPVDQRLMAYLELFKIVVKCKNNVLADLSPGQQQLDLISLNSSLEFWFYRVFNDLIDPHYQTFSKPQDRNRLVIPYTFARMWANGRVVDAGILTDEIIGTPGHYLVEAVNNAVESAFLLLDTAFDSQALARSLRYTIDYSSMTLTAALSFLSRVVALRQATGFAVDVQRVVRALERARDVFEKARAFSHAEWTRGLIGECISAS